MMNFKSWQKGLTGYPIIDAGMRELWKTGYMHNRLRMITGSFLVKNLLLHWHHGEKWFWDCLLMLITQVIQQVGNGLLVQELMQRLTLGYLTR